MVIGMHEWREVVESGWFDRDNLPEIPHKGSIARQMIDEWLQEQDQARKGV